MRGEREQVFSDDPFSDGLVRLMNGLSHLQYRVNYAPLNQVHREAKDWLIGELAELERRAVALLRMHPSEGKPSYDMEFVLRLSRVYDEISMPERVNQIRLDPNTKFGRTIRGVLAILRLNGPSDIATMTRYLSAIGVIGDERNPAAALSATLSRSKLFEASDGVWRLRRQPPGHKTAAIRQLERQVRNQ
jgi:hypothetical protein